MGGQLGRRHLRSLRGPLRPVERQPALLQAETGGRGSDARRTLVITI